MGAYNLMIYFSFANVRYVFEFQFSKHPYFKKQLGDIFTSWVRMRGHIYVLNFNFSDGRAFQIASGSILGLHLKAVISTSGF
jgi:hypothetical protein